MLAVFPHPTIAHLPPKLQDRGQAKAATVHYLHHPITMVMDPHLHPLPVRHRITMCSSNYLRQDGVSRRHPYRYLPSFRRTLHPLDAPVHFTCAIHGNRLPSKVRRGRWRFLRRCRQAKHGGGGEAGWKEGAVHCTLGSFSLGSYSFPYGGLPPSSLFQGLGVSVALTRRKV